MSQAGIVDFESANPQIPTLFTADQGSAIPVANELVIDGLTVANGTYSKPTFTTGSGNTIDVNVQVGAAITGAPADKNDAGLVSFDDTMFTVDANGYVQLIGGSDAIDTITGDDAVAVFPDGAGNLNFVGSVVANATNAKPLYFDGTEAANTQTLEIQVATTLPLAPADTNDAGICSFNSLQFDVDANGYVTLAGGSAAVDSNTGDDGVTVFPDVAGNFNWIGLTVANATHAKPVFFKDSSTANALDLDVQVGAAITGAPGDKNDAGLVSFDDTAFAVDANGYVTMIGGGSAIEQFTLDDTNIVTPTSGNVNMFGQDTPNENGVETYRISANEIGIRMASPFTLENFTFSTASAGTSRNVTVANTDNTNSASDAAIIASVGGTSGGEPYLSVVKGSSRAWAIGMYQGSSGDLVFANTAGSSTTPDSGTSILNINALGNITGTGTESGTNHRAEFRNTNDTADSSYNLQIKVAGSSAGDPYSRWTVDGAQSYSLGIDNSDSDALCLTNTGTLDGTNFIRVDSTGVINYPFQSAFLAYLETNAANVTGTGTAYTIGTAALTEVFDQNGDFNTNGTFTAPITGRYQLNAAVGVQGCTIATTFVLTLITSNRSYVSILVRAAGSGSQSLNVQVLADMDVGDTATCTIAVTGEAADTDDITGSATVPRTFMSGFLAC